MIRNLPPIHPPKFLQSKNLGGRAYNLQSHAGFTRQNFPAKISGGFTLFIAIMVTGLFLAIGATIYRIALIELILSSTGRESQSAFYAADTGAECALYWNYHYAFSGHDGSGSAFNVGNMVITTDPVIYEQSNREKIEGGGLPKIQCLGVSGAPLNVINFREGLIIGGQQRHTTFELNSNGICATVEVAKSQVPDSEPPVLKTEIVSHGYSTCAASDRRVERAIKVILQ